MRFLTDQKELADAVSHATRIIGRDDPLIRIHTGEDTVTVNAAANGAWASSTVNAEILEPGAVTVNGLWFNVLTNAMPSGETDVETGDTGMLSLHGGDTSLRMRVSPVDDPLEPADAPDHVLDVAADDWERLCRSVVHAAGNEPSRPILGAIRLTGDAGAGTLTATATNRYVVGERSIPLPGVTDGEWLIPCEWVKRNMKGVTGIGVTDRTFTVRTPRDTDTTVRLDGQYPNVDGLWWNADGATASITVDRAQLASTAKMLKSVCFDTRTSIIPLLLDEHQGMLRVRYAGVGDDMDSTGARMLSADMSGVPSLCVNADYLINVLEAMDAERVTIRQTDAAQTYVFDQDGDHVRQLVMRVQQN
ncbi:DNA polymerase III subunit beta [Bifidobacterium sp. SO1]|uniref:DNA polymerase III subunit beta n=1 Tax=Bifidobacterium sp. SO1 TaxID=2809029 RepID=UPI001BDBCE19|nr:DNA polymerase III subunit beta [Bifidobacterium sp. SO1]MBT1161840.1 DNA polymerase III subunit beta [Bifidobacterium sp. SO1]